MQPLTLYVIAVFSLSPRVKLERGASLETFPRGAWERSGWGRCGDKDRSHALRGNAATDALRHCGFQPVAKGEAGTRSVPGGVTTRSVGTIRVVRCGDKDRSHALRHSGLDLVDNGEAGTRSVPGDIPTRSVGTIRVGRCGDKDRSHALRGNAATDALRHSGFQPVAKGEAGTRSVPGDIPLLRVGMIMGGIRPT